MAQVTTNYVLEVTAKGLKEVVREIKALRKDMAGMSTATSTAAAGMSKVSKSAGEVDRNAKGAANATNNSTKAFSKMAQGMQGTLVPAYATVAANVFALTAAFGALERAADTQILIKASEELAVQTGRSLTSVANSMKEITGNAISMKEALTSASIAASAGFDNSTIEQLTQVARNASVALGRDLTDSLNRVFKGAIKAEPELLDELGIILRLDPATRAYAASVGKAVGDLTTFEKQQAVVNAVLEQGQEKFGRLSEVDVNPYTKLAATFTDVTQSLVKLLSGGLAPLISFFADNTGAMTAAVLLFANSVLKKAIPALTTLGSKFAEIGEMKLQGLSNTAQSYTIAMEQFADNKILNRGAGNIKNVLNDIEISMSTTLDSTNKTVQGIREGFDNIMKSSLGDQAKLRAVNKYLKESIEQVGQSHTIAGSEIEDAMDGVQDAYITTQIATSKFSKTLLQLQARFPKVSASALKLSLTLKSLGTGAAIGFMQGFENGLNGIEDALDSMKGKIRDSEGSLVFFEKGILRVTKATGYLGVAMKGLLRVIPIIGQLYLAWEVLSGIVTWVLDKFRDNDAIEDTNSALEKQTEAIKTATKAAKTYNETLKNAPKTIDNVTKSLELQKNILTELNTANKEIIDNAGGFDELWGSDIDDLTDNLNNMLDVLIDMGAQDEVNRFLKEFGENGKIVEETALAASKALPSMTKELLNSASAAEEANNKITEAFDSMNTAAKDIIATIPKLDGMQKMFVSIQDAMSAIEDTDITTQVSALASLDTSTLRFAGIEEEVNKITALIEATKELEDQTIETKNEIDKLQKEITQRNEGYGWFSASLGDMAGSTTGQLQSQLDLLESTLADSTQRVKDIQIEALSDIAETAKDKLGKYVEELEKVVYAQGQLTAKAQRLKLELSLPSLSVSDTLFYSKEQMKAELESIYLVQKAATAAVEAVSKATKQTNSTLINWWNTLTPQERNLPGMVEALKMVQDARKEEKETSLEQLQLTLINQEASSKAFDTKLSYLNILRKEYDKILEKDRLNIDVESEKKEIWEEMIPILKELGRVQLGQAETAENFAVRAASNIKSFGIYSQAIANAGNVTTASLYSGNMAMEDRIRALAAESEYLKINQSLLDQRIDRENLLKEAELERIDAIFFEALTDENIIDPTDTQNLIDLLDLIAEARKLNKEVGSELIKATLDQENLQLELINKRAKAELDNSVRITKAKQIQLDYEEKKRILMERVGELQEEEYDRQLELLDIQKKQRIKLDIASDLKSATDEISNFSDIILELNDRAKELGNDGLGTINAGLAAMAKIAQESGSGAAISFSSLAVAAADFAEAMKDSEADKVALSLGFASQAMSSLAQGMDEGSKAAKALQIANIALATTSAVLTILKQGKEGEAYSAFARMAAAATIVSGVLSAAGIAFSGGTGGGSGPSAREEYEASFGDDRITGQEYQTNAWVDSLDNLTAVNDALFGAEKDLKRAIYALKESIDNTAKALYAQGGSFSAGDIASKFGKSFGTETAGNQFLWASGSDTSQLVAAGVQFSASIEIAGGEIVATLQDQALFITEEVTKTRTGLLGRTRTSTSLKTTLQALTSEVSDGLIEAIEGSTDTLLQLLDNLGIDIENTFKDYKIDFGLEQLNLTGLSAEEQGNVVAAYLSGMGNEILQETVPWLDQYRNAGEELLDTLIRLVKNTKILDKSFKIAGTSIDKLARIGDYAGYTFQDFEVGKADAITTAVDELASVNDAMAYFNTVDTSSSGPGRNAVAERVAELDYRFTTAEDALAWLDNTVSEAGHGILSPDSINADEAKSLVDAYGKEQEKANRRLAAAQNMTYKQWHANRIAQDRQIWIDALEEAYGGSIEDFSKDFERFAKGVFSPEQLQEFAIQSANAAITEGFVDLEQYITPETRPWAAALIESIDSAEDVGYVYQELAKEGFFAGEAGAALAASIVALGLGYIDLEEAQDSLANATKDFIKDINREIALFGLEGKELDLQQLEFDYADAMEEAAQFGLEAMNRVELLYGLKRIEIIEDYHQEIIGLLEDGYASVGDSMLEIIRNAEDWNEVVYQNTKIQRIARRLLNNSGGKFAEAIQPILDSIRGTGIIPFEEAFGQWLYFSEEMAVSAEDQIAVTEELHQAIMDRYEAEYEAVEELKQLSLNIRDYLDSLAIGDLSPLTNMQKFNELSSRFAQDLVDIKSDDSDRASAAAESILDNADSLLRLGSELFAIGPEYQALFSYVAGSLEAVGLDLEEKIGTDQEALNGLYQTTLVQLDAVNDILGVLRGEEESSYIQEIGIALNELKIPMTELTTILGTLPDDIVAAIRSYTWWPTTYTELDPDIPPTTFSSNAVGNYDVPFDQLSLIHQGEMIIPSMDAQAIRDGSVFAPTGAPTVNNTEVINAINVLTQVLAESQEELINQGERQITTTRDIVNTQKANVAVGNVGII